MSKTVDDLRETYTTAYEAAISSYDYDDDAVHCIAHAERAGIAAVIRAVRENFIEAYLAGRDEEKPYGQIARGAESFVSDLLNEILGSDAGSEKVAGGPTREDGRSVEQLGATASHAVTAPATDPAPAVCEWTASAASGLFSAKCQPHNAFVRPVDNCHLCGLPIKFTEAK